MKYDVTIEGHSYTVDVALASPENAPVVAPSMVAAPKAAVQTAPVPAVPAASASLTESTTISAPMPGNILNVPVSVGQSVHSGEVLVLLEAMKMENEIVSPRDGVVESIAVNKGDIVESNALLMVLS